MVTKIDLNQSDNPREIVVDLVSRLADGEIAQLTIDSGHILIAWSQRPEAVERLAALCGDAVSLTLAVTSIHQAADFLSEISTISRRLMTRCWPGPLEIRVPLETAGGLLDALPQSVRSHLVKSQQLHLLCPKSPFFRDLQKLLSGPVVLTSPLSDDKLTAVLAEKTADEPARGLNIIVCSEPPRFPEGPTIVEIQSENWELLQSGAIPPRNLKRMSGTVFLFVCTGNTCRSPMAEGLFRKMLAERVQCDAEDLPDRGYLVLSAGIAAAEGGPAAPEAVELLEDQGIDIADHTSRQLTESLLDQSDHVITMTRGHRQAILSSRPDLSEKIKVIAADGSDIPDPIGSGMEQYQACKSEIERHLSVLLDQLSPS